MVWRVQSRPTRTEIRMAACVDVGSLDPEMPARFEQLLRCPQESGWLVYVLDDMADGDRIELAAAVDQLIQRPLVDVKSLGACDCRRL